MAEINKPNYSELWASGGAIVAPSDAKIQTGWTAEVPPFQWENWSQNRQDQAIAHILQHGIPVWDAITEYQAEKSYVTGSDGTIYKAVTTNTNVNPVTDLGTNWSSQIVDIPIATEAVAGIVELASNAETFLGTNTTNAVTPASIVAGILGASLLNATGYITIPVKVGVSRTNCIIQWGNTGTVTSGSNTTTNFPIVFPNACFRVLTTTASAVNISQGYTAATSSTATTSSFVTYGFGTSGGNSSHHWIAIGW